MKKRTILLLMILPIVAAYQMPASSGPAPERQTSASNTPPMFVLQVGISRYADGKRWPALSGSVNDVTEMKKLLIGERYKVKADNVHTLIDEQATKKQILQEFESHLISNAREHFGKTRRRDAISVFQFSGHGSQVPDTDGDEGDGLDESFVTYDSKDEPGRNFDITDDEIFELTRRLSQYTDNIVYILDSCHSGTGTRDSDDARRLPPRKTMPLQILTPQTRGEMKKQRDSEQTDLLPPGDDQIVISAARADQLAGQIHFFPDEQSTAPVTFGYLTFYLIGELRDAKQNTSYRELMENVTRKVSSAKPSQVPQIEGDSRRYVFGGGAGREDNFVRVLATEKATFMIGAGAMQGVTAGTVVAVYDKRETQFAEAEKIATAKVAKVFPDRAVASIIAQTRPLTTDDKAVIVSPDLGALRLKANLDLDENKLTADEKKVLQNVRSAFTPEKSDQPEPRGVDVVASRTGSAGPSNWDVALLKDAFGSVFPNSKGTAQARGDGDAERPQMPAAAKLVFYLADRDFVPLYGFYVETDRADAAAVIERALVHLARLRSVKAIANQRSALKGKITITPHRYSLASPPCDATGRIITVGKSVPALNAAKNAFKFRENEVFWLEIANSSKSDLYLAVIDIGTDGSVKLLAPRKISGERDEGIVIFAGEKRVVPGVTCRDGAIKTTLPAGIETFKVIASTQPIRREDFEFLEMEAVKRGEVKSLTDLGDWTTAEVNFEISVGPIS